MFKRRIPLPFHRRARSFLWPRGGWRRSGTYVAHRLRRLPGPPYRIAAGFASGAAISFTPFIGLHFVLATLLALCIRGNIVASAIGTMVRSEEHTSELQSLMRTSYAVFCLKKKNTTTLEMLNPTAT